MRHSGLGRVSFWLFPILCALSRSSVTSAISAPSVAPTIAVGRLPALGWNTWNENGLNINEHKVLDAAHSFINLGFQKAGYTYINVDGWSDIKGRDPITRQLVPDFTKFPDGIDGTAYKVHALGLKFGIYSVAGAATCQGYPASLGFEATDAKIFSDWGVDYLKYDNCHIPLNWSDRSHPEHDYDYYNSNTAIRFRQMGEALASVPRPILYALCEWGTAEVWKWGAKVGHSWRVKGDIIPTWDSVISAIATNVQYLDYVDFGAHNDMDILEIGDGPLTVPEQRTHFAVWAFMKSPILLGSALSTLSPVQIAILTNAELLAFNQDTTVGPPAKPFSEAVNTPIPEFYAGKSQKGTHVFIVNTGGTAVLKTVTFSNVPGLGAGRWKVHDMWTSKDLGTFTDSFSIVLASHDTAALLITT